MTSLDFSRNQLIREVQLLLSEIALLVHWAVGSEEAAFAALDLKANSDFRSSSHPDDLTDVERYDLWRHVDASERYVREQVWTDAIEKDVRGLELIVERVFSPSVVRRYEDEREAHPELDDEADVQAYDERYAEVLAFHYRGILHTLVQHAKARLKVDQDIPLTLADMALLVDAREATVMTAAHRGNFPTVTDDNRRVADPRDQRVMDWLQARGYKPTRSLRPASPKSALPAKPQYLFVPVSRDGSWFSPSCRTANGYAIGDKGDEKRHTDYFAALDDLLRMPAPRWRRRSKAGVPSTVTAVRYDRIERTEIERLIDALHTP